MFHFVIIIDGKNYLLFFIFKSKCYSLNPVNDKDFSLCYQKDRKGTFPFSCNKMAKSKYKLKNLSLLILIWHFRFSYLLIWAYIQPLRPPLSPFFLITSLINRYLVKRFVHHWYDENYLLYWLKIRQDLIKYTRSPQFHWIIDVMYDWL